MIQTGIVTETLRSFRVCFGINLIRSRAVDHAGRRHICWFRDGDSPGKVGEEEEAAHLKSLIPGLISRQSHQSNESRQKALIQLIPEQRVSIVKAGMTNMNTRFKLVFLGVLAHFMVNVLC